MSTPTPAPSPRLPRTWLQSDRVLARRVARPVNAFLHVEASGGILLVVATVVALVWANSPWKASYHDLFHAEIVVQIGSFRIEDSVSHAINDGLMALFFFVVGLEIKREWVVGELRDRRAAVLPAFAALGGMVLPALIYVAINAGGPGVRGWGIPMATDIAFALGVIAVLGSRVPGPLKVFLLTLAIVDDIGAIIVIALFYSGPISVQWLVGAVAVTLLVWLAREVRIRYLVVYVALGAALWFCLYESGVHATIAGVILGLLTPAIPFLSADQAEAIVDELEDRRDLTAAEVRRVSFLISESVPATDRLINALHPWTSYVIVPIFALANAGIELGGDSLRLGSRITIGVIAGLVIGKTVGIAAFSWLAVKLGWGALPEGVTSVQMLGIAAVAGIGFTVSLFVADLAFEGAVDLSDAKVGILIASIVAAIIGSAILALGASRSSGDAGGAADGVRVAETPA